MKLRTKRRLIETGILVAVFVIAVAVFSHFTNKGNESMTADMGAATFPQVSFSYDGYSVNDVPGYAKAMDMTAVRDTITPVVNGRVGIDIDAHEKAIKSVNCQVYTLDGMEMLFEENVKAPGESVTLEINDETVMEEERMLQITLNFEGEDSIYYYTRIADAGNTELLPCLDYIRSFHENALKKSENSGIGTAIEADETGDNSTFQHVTIHSDYDHVTWGGLEPQVEGGERWSIKEMNSVYTSVQLEYIVHCKGEENEIDEYKVQEFYRVRHIANSNKTYLLDYEREMNQIFNPTQTALNEKGILLGIADSETPYLVSGDGTIVAFVQADELWCYNQNRDEASLVFSFAATENTDERNRISQHEIRLLEADDAGNLIFAVYGYMNRGVHEGEVGVAIYTYNIEKSSVEEKVFISTDQSYAHVIREFGKLIYYDAEADLLYVLVDGSIYEMNLEINTQNVLVEGLGEDQYVVSDDGVMIAYQTGESAATSTEIMVKNFATGKEFSITCEENECIQPLGFMDTDVVYGVAKMEDVGQTTAGEAVIAMYKVEIQNNKGTVVKTYKQSGQYVLGAKFDEKMITLNRAKKKGATYASIGDDYITNNEANDESNIFLESYVTELKQRQMRLTFNEGIADKAPKILKPKQVFSKNPREVVFDNLETQEKYYVYGYGKLQGIYDKAGDAIAEAENYSGVVVSWEQDYVWERGNRDLQYHISEDSPEVKTVLTKLEKGEFPMEIMEEISDGRSLDLTGCTTEELLYVINQGSPVIAMINEEKSVVLTGYGNSTVTYISVASGEKDTATFEEMDKMTKGSGHTYVGMIVK
ncbi:MAG: hypothetical protein ACI4UH_00625 [Dorea sp.]